MPSALKFEMKLMYEKAPLVECFIVQADLSTEALVSSKGRSRSAALTFTVVQLFLCSVSALLSVRVAGPVQLARCADATFE